MAEASGSAVKDVVSGGIGLAFIAFPTIINQAPFGAVIGVLFFGSLVFAGFTSMISIVEVLVAAVQDKLRLRRVPATLAVCLPMAVVSTLMFGTSAGLPLLDVLDKFVNTYGIVAGGFVYVLMVVLTGRLPALRAHLNSVSSFKLGAWWYGLIGLTVILLGYMLFQGTAKLLAENYSGYPDWFLNLFGWGMSALLVISALLLSLLPWKTPPQPDSSGSPETKQGENP